MAEAIHAVTLIDPRRCREAAIKRFSAARMTRRYIELYNAMAYGQDLLAT
jgi:glycosyltransferase involved in cell wall biosynthesis